MNNKKDGHDRITPSLIITFFPRKMCETGHFFVGKMCKVGRFILGKMCKAERFILGKMCKKLV